jgi:hypothetical protein
MGGVDDRIKLLGIGLAWIALVPGCTPNASGTDTVEPTGETETAESGSSGEMMCTDDDSQVLWATEGMLTAPMELALADSLGFDVARSLMAEQGSLTLSFTLACDGPLHMFALVWDMTGSNEPENADSLYISVDGGEEVTWLYGCSTVADDDERWWWLPIEVWTMSNCDHVPIELDLAAGEHTITLRNREQGAAIDVAAIAGVVVSHDQGVDLNQYHDLMMME